VHIGNTTKKHLYKALLDDHHVTHISNENIPNTFIPMATKNDPFCLNNKAIFEVLRKKIIPQTQFFPERLDMKLQLQETIHLVGTPYNKFHGDEIFAQEKSMKKQLPSHFVRKRTILEHVFPENIAVNKSMVPLVAVGKNHIQSGNIFRLPGWRSRRAAKQGQV